MKIRNLEARIENYGTLMIGRVVLEEESLINKKVEQVKVTGERLMMILNNRMNKKIRNKNRKKMKKISRRNRRRIRRSRIYKKRKKKRRKINK